MTDSHSIRLDHFIAAANAAYYARKNPFSDFITAPEISQIFGEMLAVWVITVARSMDQYHDIALVEAGPGRGTLMADMLRIIRQAAPDIYQKCSVIFIETSPRLKEIQRQAVADYIDVSVRWYQQIEDIPQQPMILVANEFFDALPIRQFIKIDEHQWAEHYVEQSKFVQYPVKDLPFSPIFKRDIGVGDIVEVCEIGQNIVASLTEKIKRDGGAILLIDYGYASDVWGDTLQAIADGRKSSPLLYPGQADLTAHIDFLALKEIALSIGANVYGIQTQGEFLKQLGLIMRAKILSQNASLEDQQEISQAVYRLSDPSEMGDLFKVMAICNPALPAPPAFEINKEE